MKSFVWNIVGLLMQEKLLLEYIVTSPQVNELGYYRLPIEYIMVDLDMDRETVETAMESLIRKGLVSYDQTTFMVAVANFNRYYRPLIQNPMDTPLNILMTLPTSAVFATCYAWLKKTLREFAAKELEESDWVKTALEMEAPAFEKTTITVPTKRSAKKVQSAKTEAKTADKDEGQVALAVGIEPPTATVETSVNVEEKVEADAVPTKGSAVETTEVAGKVVETTEEATPVTKEPVANEAPTVEVPAANAPTEETPAENVTENSEVVANDAVKTPVEVPAVTESAAPAETSADAPVEETTLIDDGATKQEAEAAPKKAAPRKAKGEDDPVTQQHIAEFESLWARLPRKNDKRTARTGYLQMVKNGELTFEVASKAVDNFLYQNRINKTEDQYIIGGAALFSKERRRIFEFVQEEVDTNMEEADKKLRVELTPRFGMFWILYPKKTGREIAEKNFFELVRSGDFTPEKLIEAATNYKSECDAKHTEERFIMRADTFLDLKTRPFRDYLNRNDLNTFVNVHSGKVEMVNSNGIEAMEQMLANAKKEKEEKAAATQTNAARPATKEAAPQEEEEATFDSFIQGLREDKETNDVYPDTPSDFADVDAGEEEAFSKALDRFMHGGDKDEAEEGATEENNSEASQVNTGETEEESADNAADFAPTVQEYNEDDEDEDALMTADDTNDYDLGASFTDEDGFVEEGEGETEVMWELGEEELEEAW